MTLSEPLIFKDIKSWWGKLPFQNLHVPGVCWQGYFIDTEGNTLVSSRLMRQQSKNQVNDSYWLNKHTTKSSSAKCTQSSFVEKLRPFARRT